MLNANVQNPKFGPFVLPKQQNVCLPCVRTDKSTAVAHRGCGMAKGLTVSGGRLCGSSHTINLAWHGKVALSEQLQAVAPLLLHRVAVIQIEV
jgi:hypothetical protein